MKPVRARYNRIEQLVHEMLVSNSITAAPVPVDVLAKRAGAQVQEHDFKNEISGMLLRTNGQQIIAVEASQHPVRKRFTIAHELGHLLLHQGEEVRIDTDFRVNLRSSSSSTAEYVEEIEANAFAASLLMPEQFLKRDMHNVDYFDIEDASHVKRLAGLYKVSAQAMTIRLVNLVNLNRL